MQRCWKAVNLSMQVVTLVPLLFFTSHFKIVIKNKLKYFKYRIFGCIIYLGYLQRLVRVFFPRFSTEKKAWIACSGPEMNVHLQFSQACSVHRIAYISVWDIWFALYWSAKTTWSLLSLSRQIERFCNLNVTVLRLKDCPCRISKYCLTERSRDLPKWLWYGLADKRACTPNLRRSPVGLDTLWSGWSVRISSIMKLLYLWDLWSGWTSWG